MSFEVLPKYSIYTLWASLIEEELEELFGDFDNNFEFG